MDRRISRAKRKQLLQEYDDLVFMRKRFEARMAATPLEFVRHFDRNRLERKGMTRRAGGLNILRRIPRAA